MEDKSGPKSWALSAALFVPITGTQEEQPRNAKKKKLWWEAPSVPNAFVLQSVGYKTSEWSVSCCSLEILSYLWIWQKRFTSWYSLQHLYPAPVHIMTWETGSFMLLYVCHSLQLSYRWEQRLFSRGVLWITSSSWFHVGNTKNSLSFPRYCMPWKTCAERSKNFK